MPQTLNHFPLQDSVNADPGHIHRCAVIIPTLNATRHWDRLHGGLLQQGVASHRVLVVDSSSDDETRALVDRAGYNLVVIPRTSFRHGATRQMAAHVMRGAEFLIYLTQDAIPLGEQSLSNLLKSFDDPFVGAAYGRQLPRPGANAIERHARLFNYPDASAVRDLESRAALGFRAAYFSNSFAAYRRSAFEEVGGFPENAIVSEDVSVSSRMLLAGWKLAYCAEAEVIHSHALGLRAEFTRYFDIAVHHHQEEQIMQLFGSVGGEGVNFVRSELRYLREHAPGLIPLALLRSLSKWTAYQSGRREQVLPLWLKRAMSAQPTHWNNYLRERSKMGAGSAHLRDEWNG